MSAASAQKTAFHIDRRNAPFYVLRNSLSRPMFSPQFFVTGDALLSLLPTQRLAPGACLPLLISGDNLALDSVLLITWRDAHGNSYHWSTSF